jgi:4-aminobutyrate aminotransferase-like enzyme/Ser/Thr protein kinase RdoA (MazF antagonist)
MKIEHFLAQNYNLIDPAIHNLVGYDFDNYSVECNQRKFILKVCADEKNKADFAQAENEVLLHLQKKENNKFPAPIKNKDDEFLTNLEAENSPKTARLLTFLEGEFLAKEKHGAQLFESLGKLLAEMDLGLKDFQNYTIAARQNKWDLQYFLLNEKYIQLIPNPSDRKIVEYFFIQYKQNVLPLLPSLRKQIIHGDANDWNILTQNGLVSGIIDFGDVCYSQLINELAIAITYAIMGKENPVEWAIPIISAYHKILPLEEKETDILYWLVAARLCTSVCNSANEKIENPENTYTQISENPAWDLLKKWIAINPVFARNEFRKATGFEIPTEKTVEEKTVERFKSVSPIFSISYKKPIYMDSSAFQYMFDKYGNSYLDAYNNIPHVGHSHPKVVEAGQMQMAKLNTNTRYLYDSLNEYSASLLKKFPAPLNKVFFVNSGSAATDLALRLARNFTRKNIVAVVEHGYHGNTQAGIEISHYKFGGKGGKGISENVICLPIPDLYRGGFKFENAGSSYAQNAIHQMRPFEGEIAAFIAEPIVGCGGQVPLAKGYLKEIYADIRTQGGVCISDEVQTGFGRLGDVFWGFEQHGVVPDMVILGKPMGNGHPMGAVVCTNEIAEAFNNGMEFFSSFGGNPVSCAIGQAVLDVIEEEQLQKNAKIVGDYYIEELSRLQQKYECIGDVRGSGLFIGFEFVKDRMTLEPDTKLAQKVKNELRENFVLVSTDGPFDNVIKSKPPLCFTKGNVDEVVGKLDSILFNK